MNADQDAARILASLADRNGVARDLGIELDRAARVGYARSRRSP